MTKIYAISPVKHGFFTVLLGRLKFTEFYMGVNLEIAPKADIVIPDEILMHADDIIPYKETNSP